MRHVVSRIWIRPQVKIATMKGWHSETMNSLRTTIPPNFNEYLQGFTSATARNSWRCRIHLVRIGSEVDSSGISSPALEIPLHSGPLDNNAALAQFNFFYTSRPPLSFLYIHISWKWIPQHSVAHFLRPPGEKTAVRPNEMQRCKLRNFHPHQKRASKLNPTIRENVNSFSELYQ